MPRAAFVAMLLAAPVARAHNAAPVALDVHFVDKAGARSVVVDTNYGLISRDARGQWRLLCEEVVTPGAKWFTLDDDGAAIGMGHEEGFSRSTDGCDFAPSTGADSSVEWVERAKSPTGPDAIFLLLDDQTPGANVERSLDDGVTFSPLPVPDSLVVNALRADANHPGHIVATAETSSGSFVLLDSVDLGTTWTEQPVPLSPGTVRVLGVTPSGVFLRRVGPGIDELYRATDDGQTIELVLTLGNQPLFISSVSAHELWVSGGEGEVYRSASDGDSGTWVKMPTAGDMTCLRKDGETLYACVVDLADNAAVRTSIDGGATWKDYLRFSQVASMVSCPIDSDVAKACDALWPQYEIGMGIPLTPPSPPATTNSSGCNCGGSSALVLVFGLPLWWRRRKTGVGAFP